MNKELTIIGINFTPEDTAIGLYSGQMATYFKENKVAVNVITGFPYYPKWEVNKSYQQKKSFFKEEINGIKIYRYKQYVPKNPTFFKRIIHILDFTFGSVINLFKIKKTDVVLCIVPFTSSILLGYFLAKLKGAKLWVHIQDFEFDAAIDAKLSSKNSSKNTLFKCLFFIEKILLNRASLISTISNAMLAKLNSKATSSIPKVMLPNWVNLNQITPKNNSQHTYINKNKFSILYSGNIGEKQDWDFFLQFAKALTVYKNIEIIVVGDGAKKDWLIKKLHLLENVTWKPPVPYIELSDLLCSVNLHVLFQKTDVVDTVMPSKILSMMASGKKSIITGNQKSEVATIIHESKSGLYVSNFDLDAITKYVTDSMDNKIQENYYETRQYLEMNFSADIILKKFLNSFNTI